MDEDRLLRIEDKIDKMNDKLTALTINHEVLATLTKHRITNYKIGLTLLSLINSIIIFLFSMKILK